MYLYAYYPDIMRFLDTKRENADEKIRIKTLSLGVVIPDITFELTKNNEDMCLFSPYDVERVHGVPFADIDVTGKYREMVDDERIKKTRINALEISSAEMSTHLAISAIPAFPGTQNNSLTLGQNVFRKIK